MIVVPSRLDTARLALRRWKVSLAPMLKQALDANVGHLAGRIPSAVSEPAPLPEIVARIERYRESFDAGTEWIFAILSDDERRLIGGAGLYARIGAGALEIGYWAQRGETGHGYVSEAARALVGVAFDDPEITRLEIRCDPDNAASSAVARRLGFTERAPSDETHGLAVWELTR